MIKSLKQLIARRGRSSRIYSDDGQSFAAAAKWLKKVRKDERFHLFLSDQSIIWQFNLNRACPIKQPLELSCDKENVQRDKTPLNPTGPVFRPSEMRVAARLRMQEVAEEEELD